MPKPLKTFIIYAREDAAFKNELLRQLAPFAQTGLLEKWDDSHILPGEEWEKSIENALKASQIVLMLVSADSLFSDFIQRKELKKALEQKREGSTRVIPILVRDCLYDMAEGINDLQMLPLHPVSRSLVPVDDLVIWGSRASAWATALRQLREVIADVHARIEAEEKALLEEAEKMAALAAEAQRVKEALAAEAQRVKEALAAEEASQALRAREAEARAGRQRIKDEAAWKAALALDTLEAYEDYLDKGYTLHESEAHTCIGKLEEAEARRRAIQKAEEKAAAEASRAREAEERRAKEAEEKRKKEAAEKKRLAEELARKKREQAQRDADRSLQDDKKNDPFHDLMLPIKGGAFDMGDTFGEGGDSEKPVHRVTVKDFHLCKYPVTQAQWKAIMGDNPSNFKGDDLPVEKVSWDDAQAFIKKLNEMLTAGQKPYRLPSEAEWEYAAREGGKKVRFGNGKDIADPKEINFDGRKDYKQSYSVVGEYRQKTTPVATFAPNALGLHDMSGNVWEWCADHWHDNYNGAPDDGSAWTSGGDSSLRVVRGGSWGSDPDNCRAAYRLRLYSADRFVNIGFRLAR